MKTFITTILFSVVLSCNNQIKVDKNINENTIDEIITKYGTPKRESEIKLTKSSKLLEYQSNLYGLYPNINQSDTIILKELFWEFKDGDKLAVWFDNKAGKWVVIDNLSWSKNIKF